MHKEDESKEEFSIKELVCASAELMSVREIIDQLKIRIKYFEDDQTEKNFKALATTCIILTVKRQKIINARRLSPEEKYERGEYKND